MRHACRNVVQFLAACFGHDHGSTDIDAMVAQARVWLEGKHHTRLEYRRTRRQHRAGINVADSEKKYALANPEPKPKM
jgi:hypothetical protein